MNKKLDLSFYRQDVLIVAKELIGKLLVRKLASGEVVRYQIIETEAYRGEEDSACHARAGKTKRTAPMYEAGGMTYVYLCYGIHHLLNVVTGNVGEPQAVLIRGIEGFTGPGKLTKKLAIDKDLNWIDLSTSAELWIEDDGAVADYVTSKRIGIDYASEPYRSIEWRFVKKEISMSPKT